MIKNKLNGTEIFCSSFEDTNNLKNGTRIIFKCCVCGEDVVKIFRRDKIENIKLWRCYKHTCEFNRIQKYGSIDEYNKNHEKKFKQTCLERYGVENPNQLKEIKNKAKQTCLERYGTEHKFLFGSEEFKNNMLKKHGVKYSMQMPSTLKKAKETIKEKYGDEHYFAFGEGWKKAIIEKYGSIEKMYKQSSESFKQTCLEKYGVEHIAQTGLFDRKAKYEYNNLIFDSKPELAYYIYNKEKNIPIERNTKESFEYIFEEKKHKYFPDFIVNNNFVEIKGEQFLKEDGSWQNPYDHSLDDFFEAKHLCALKNKVKILYSKDCKEYVDYINNKYTKNFLELFRTDLEFPYLNKELTDKSDFGLIHYFHKSIYKAFRKNYLSPIEAWNNKNIIKEIALNRLKYVKNCRPSDILQGFNVTKKAPKVSVFNPKLAEEIINKYLSNAEIIIDPFSGFSGRMLGSFNCNKKYIGFDINKEHIKEANEIIKYKKIENICSVTEQDLITSNIKNWSHYNACLFTCPPYGDKENWLEEKIVKNCDEWIELCLNKHIGCKKYCFVVDKTEKYKNNIVDEITNKSHFGNSKEFIILINGENNE